MSVEAYTSLREKLQHEAKMACVLVTTGHADSGVYMSQLCPLEPINWSFHSSGQYNPMVFPREVLLLVKAHVQMLVSHLITPDHFK